MSSIIWYVLDTETNGLKSEGGFHEICEISIIRCSDKTQLTRTVRVNNIKNSSYDALKITGKTIDDLKNGVSKLEAINDVDAFLQQDGLTPAHRCIVAHNSNFDLRFLHHMWREQNKDFLADLWLDTIPLSKRLAAQMGQPKAKVKLEMAMDLFGLKKYGGNHTAKGDSRNTFILWKHLMNSDIEYIDLIKQFPHRKIEIATADDMEEFE